MLVFNPPYVPTAADEVAEAQLAAGIAGAWAGGADGMRVTDVLLGQVEVSGAHNAVRAAIGDQTGHAGAPFRLWSILPSRGQAKQRA